MAPGDRVTLPDGRSGIIWRIADGYAWVNLDGHHFQVERWRSVDVVVRHKDMSGQLPLPFEVET